MSGSPLLETLTTAFAERRPALRVGERAFKRFLSVGLPWKQEWGKQLPLDKLSKTPLKPSAATPFQVSGARALHGEEALRFFGSYMTSRAERQILEGGSPFAVLNTAFCDDVTLISIPEGSESTIDLRQVISSEKEALISPRLHLLVGKGAKASLALTISHEGDALMLANGVIDLHLEEGAQVELLLHTKEPLPFWLFQELRATLKERSHLAIFTKSFGGLCHRQAFQCVLEGEEASVNISTLVVGAGKSEAQIDVTMEHRARNQRSYQLIKALMDETSRVGFEGKIAIMQEGQGCEAYQLNRNLLLSPAAQAYSRPTLEIHADEVKASHGATTAAIDEEPLFYLLSRGIEAAMARELLVHAFCDEVFMKLSPQLRRLL